jgi:probable HAF family extracellular repeat protein
VGGGDDGKAHGFLTNGVTFTTLDGPSASRTVAHGINKAGQIVGEFQVGGTRTHGFLATPVAEVRATDYAGNTGAESASVTVSRK